MSLRFLIVLVIAITVIVSVPLGFAAISYSFVFSITDSDGSGDNFDGATAIITDSQDRIIALDNGWRGGHDHRIAIFATDGTFLSSFLSGGDISTDDNYYDITTDSEDRIIISDKGFKKIKIFSSDGVNTFNITDADGIGGEFDTPLGVATDSEDRIIVSDSKNSRVQIFDKNGTFELSIGFDDWTSGVTTDSDDRIIVADHFFHRIQIFDSQGNFIRQFGTQGDGDGEFAYPSGVTTDSDDRIIVADRDNYRVQIFDKNGQYLAQFGSLGSGDGEFASPRYITTDSQDRILVSDSHHRIQIFTMDETKKSGGSSSCSDCIPPTMRDLTAGFSFNGNVTNINNRITSLNETTTIGQNNTLAFTVYENRGINEIDHIHLKLGLEDLYDKEEVDIKFDLLKGNIKETIINDKQNLIQNVTASTIKVNCDSKECLKIIIHFTYRESPMYNGIIIEATDSHPRYEQNFLDGISVNGISMNPPNTLTVGGVDYFEVNKQEKIWRDEDGNLYEKSDSYVKMSRI